METTNCHCTNCGKQMDINAAFCTKCGVSKGKTKHFCGNCGVSVSEEQDFCIQCGNKLSNKIDLSKGKESLQKFTQAAVTSTNNFAEVASKKTGKKIKGSWIAGTIGVVVVLVVVFFMLNLGGLRGTYTTEVWGEEISITFSGKKYKTSDGESGTYKIDGNKISFTVDGSTESEDGEISSDKKSLEYFGFEFEKE